MDENNNKPRMSNGLKIFLLILAGCIIFGIGLVVLSNAQEGDTTFLQNSFGLSSDIESVAIITVEGSMMSNSSGGIYGSSGYDHQWTLDTIDDLMNDDKNEGILLYMDTPGGEVIVGDELYLKLREYKEQTGRPVWAYFHAQSTSAGYYVGSICDKIVANRNCVTGSIGVKVGTFYDFSGLMEDYGVKAFDIDSGEYKSMGSSFREMSESERAIWQAYIDEAYEQFLNCIVEGRGMEYDYVKSLADGRIYTAKQALELGLIDDIGDYDKTIAMMRAECDFSDDVEFEALYPPVEEPTLFEIISMFSSAKDAGTEGILSPNSVKGYYMADNYCAMYE